MSVVYLEAPERFLAQAPHDKVFDSEEEQLVATDPLDVVGPCLKDDLEPESLRDLHTTRLRALAALTYQVALAKQGQVGVRKLIGIKRLHDAK